MGINIFKVLAFLKKPLPQASNRLRERFSIYIERFNVPLDNVHAHALHRGDEGIVVLSVGRAVKGGSLSGDVLNLEGGCPGICDEVVHVDPADVGVLIGVVRNLMPGV